MALDPRIPLGVQPMQTQQPNMLAQYAQIMGIRAAQQEMEGNEKVAKFFSAPEDQRGDPTSLLGSKQGRETYKALNEGRIKQLEAEQKRINLIGAGAGAVLQNPTMETFTTVVSDLVNRGIYTPKERDQAFATIGNDPSKIKAFVTPIFNQAIDAEKQLANETSIANNQRSTAASYYSSNVSRDNSIRTDQRAREELQYLQGENGFVGVNKFDPNSARYVGMRPSAPPAAATQTQPSAVNNLMMTTQPTPSLNALAPTAPNQAGPTVAAANALASEPTIIKPKQPIRQPVAVMKDGKSVLVSPQEAVGMQPATAFNEKTAEDKAKVGRDLETAIRNLELVVKPGGLLEKSTGSGFGRMVDASAGFFGQSTEGAVAGAQLAPIADMVLKMVPRFEGPQSNKDVDSYLAAAGKLADTGLPNDVRAGAAKVILKLMKERKDQFVIKGQESGGGASLATGGSSSDPLGLR